MNTYFFARLSTVDLTLLIILLSIGILWVICRIMRLMIDDNKNINGKLFDPEIDFAGWESFSEKLKKLKLPEGWIEANRIELLMKLLRLGKKDLALDICYHTPVTYDDLLEAAILAPDNAVFERYVHLCRSVSELERLQKLAKSHGEDAIVERLKTAIHLQSPVPHAPQIDVIIDHQNDREIGGM